MGMVEHNKVTIEQYIKEQQNEDMMSYQINVTKILQ